MAARGAAPGPIFHCTNCSRPRSETSLDHCCRHCGGLFDFREGFSYDPVELAGEPSRGLGHYRRTFPLVEAAPLYSMGEGGTPLVPEEIGGRRVYFKFEHLNPTGSFKDRGSVVLVSALAAAGVVEAVEDSSGNAGASFAAYAARAGIRARVFVPDHASGPKREQIEGHGAEVVRILGPRSATTEAVLREVESGTTYASHAYLPHGLAGMATLAFELYEGLGRAPSALILPVGQGTLLLGAHRGFLALKEVGRIDTLPRLIAVQALACAPLWAVQRAGAAGQMWVEDGETVAEGIRILRPLRGDAVLEAIHQSRGAVIAVEETDILRGQRELASRGMLVEATSAVVWAALETVLEQFADPITVVLTGSGYKEKRDDKD